MTDAAPDPQRERLDRVAGLSRLAPRGDYAVAGLSFGAATLQRNPANGRWESLTLTLAPAVASDGVKALRSKPTTVVYPLLHWLARGDFAGDDDLSPGLYALVVDAALLSHPTWLTDPAMDPAMDPAAARALAHLRTSLEEVTHLDAPCPVCPPERRAGRARSAYPMPRNALPRESLDVFRMLGIDVRGLIDAPAPPESQCPHTPMRHEALGALFVAFPELAFEATQLLIAAPTLAPPRFVLSPVMMRGLVGAWLMGRARPGAPPPRRIAHAAPTPDDDEQWSEGQRAAEAFARGSWGFDGPLRAEGDGDAAAPVLAATEALPDVALVWPDGIARPAPRPPEAAPPKPKKPKKPTAETRPKAEAKGTAKHPTPGQEMMTPELRALGYSDAAIKGLLKDGTIERAGYGWYRWKG